MIDFGHYHIGQSFDDIQDNLCEISKEEYEILKPTLSDEKIYHAKDTAFCDTTWNVIIAITGNKIYKISLQTSQNIVVTAFQKMKFGRVSTTN